MLKRGLAAEGLPVAAFGAKSTEFGVTGKTPPGRDVIGAGVVGANRGDVLIDPDAERLDDGAPFGDFRF